MNISSEEKLCLSLLYLIGNNKLTEERREELKEELYKYHSISLISLSGKKLAVKISDTEYYLTGLGNEIAKKLSKIGLNFKKAAQSSNIGYSMSMLSAAIKNIHSKVLKGEYVIYSGKPLEKLLLKVITLCNDCLEHKENSDISEEDFQLIVSEINAIATNFLNEKQSN